MILSLTRAGTVAIICHSKGEAYVWRAELPGESQDQMPWVKHVFRIARKGVAKKWEELSFFVRLVAASKFKVNWGLRGVTATGFC